MPLALQPQGLQRFDKNRIYYIDLVDYIGVLSVGLTATAKPKRMTANKNTICISGNNARISGNNGQTKRP